MNLLIQFVLLISSKLIFAYRLDSRIAHGQNAAPHSAPYIVSLQVDLGNGEYHHSCGGSILSEHWILTAAHCLSDPERNKQQLIFAGRHNITAENEKYGQFRKIHYYKNHDEYPGGSVVAPHDIALIYVKEPFIFNKAVQPIRLPSKNSDHKGIGTLFGWGLLETGSLMFPSILQTADIPIISNKLCQQEFGNIVASSNICSANQSGQSACSSDSGGPYVQMNKLHKVVEQVGIVSWGPPCGKLGGKSITVFVRVSHYIDWIKNIRQRYENQM